MYGVGYILVYLLKRLKRISLFTKILIDPGANEVSVYLKAHSNRA